MSAPVCVLGSECTLALRMHNTSALEPNVMQKFNDKGADARSLDSAAALHTEKAEGIYFASFCSLGERKN